MNIPSYMKLPILVPLSLLFFFSINGNLEARTLTVSEAQRLATKFNRSYLAAQEQVAIAGAEVTRERAEALPRVDFTGSYNRAFDLPSFFVQTTDDEGITETIEFTTGFKNNYGANLSITQPIWSGGRVFVALSAAKDFLRYANALKAQVAAQVKLQTDILFYNVVLQQAKLDVVRKSHRAFSHNLEDIKKQFGQGLVSEYDVLRAKVEKSNLEPLILQAESNLRLAYQRLKSYLGIDLDEEIELVTEPVNSSLIAPLSLDSLVATALMKRPEMLQAESSKNLRRKAIRIARSDYYPSVSAVAIYDWQAQSDRFTLDENTSRSWTAGLRFSIPIFQGGRTRGAVTRAIAEHNQALLKWHQTRDNIRLEVEEAYDRLIQAHQALEIQTNTIAQAEEGLRIANVRYEAGVGTLLEVLSAQAALTRSREIEAEATFAFRTARAALIRATTLDLDNLK